MLVSNNAIEIGIPIATILVSGLAAYFGAFIKTMAANDANNQNFEKVLEQMKTQTAEIENIKAAISDDVWDRQEKWKLKRDLLIEVIRSLSELADALKSLYSVHCTPIHENNELKEFARVQIHNESIEFNTCNRKFYRTMYVARLVAGKELHKALTECANEMRSISSKILKEDADYFMQSESVVRPRNLVEFNADALMQKIMPAIMLARKTLDIEITE